MEVERRWRRGRLMPVLYDMAAGYESLARLGGRLLWGADVRPLFRDFAEPGLLPPGSAVLDVPCGGGVAFRGLPPGARIHYVAVDLSPVMLARARAEALRRGPLVGFVRAGVVRLPFSSGAFDLCVTYNGLHCFPDPAAALTEMARVLRPGGVLRGTTLVTGAGARQDAIAALLRRAGAFGPPLTVPGLRAALTGAGLVSPSVELRGAIAYFVALRAE